MSPKSRPSSSRRSRPSLSWPVLRELWTRLSNHDAPALSSEIAFHSLLSIGPWLVFLGSFSALVSGITGDLSGSAWKRLLETLPPGSTDLIQGISQEVSSAPKSGILSFVLIISLWSASNVVQVLTKALNRAFDVHRSQVPLLKTRLMSMAAVVASGLALAGISGLIVIIPRITGHLPMGVWPQKLIDALYLPASGFAISGVLFVLYVMLPYRRPAFRWLAWGALASGILWILAGRLMGWFVIQVDPLQKVYGSLSAMLLLMVFVYISGLITLAGAEWAAILDQKYGKHPKAKKT